MANKKSFTEVIKNGYSFKQETIKIGVAMLDGNVMPEAESFLPLKTMNRHGLVAGATGTGKTKMNLLIEVVAVFFYIIYIYLVMIKWKLSLAMAWTNEFVYWTVIFAIAFWYIKSGKWKV